MLILYLSLLSITRRRLIDDSQHKRRMGSTLPEQPNLNPNPNRKHDAKSPNSSCGYNKPTGAATCEQCDKQCDKELSTTV